MLRHDLTDTGCGREVAQGPSPQGEAGDQSDPGYEGKQHSLSDPGLRRGASCDHSACRRAEDQTDPG